MPNPIPAHSTKSATSLRRRLGGVALGGALALALMSSCSKSATSDTTTAATSAETAAQASQAATTDTTAAVASSGTAIATEAPTTAAAQAATSAAQPTSAPSASTPAPSGVPANKIVSLSPTATEILFAIGAGKSVVAVDSMSSYPADAPKTELSGFQPNVEAIAKYSPDLVVLSDDRNSVVAGLQALKISVVKQSAATKVDDTYSQIEQLGAATGHIAEAAELVKNMQTEIAATVAQAHLMPGDKRTYYHELDNTYFSATSSTFIGSIYSAFGLTNIADSQSKPDKDGGYPQLNAEYITSANPDVIFLADVKCCKVTTANVAARPGWAEINAVKNHNVVELDDDIASRWGPRVVEQYKAVAAALAKVPAAA